MNAIQTTVRTVVRPAQVRTRPALMLGVVLGMGALAALSLTAQAQTITVVTPIAGGTVATPSGVNANGTAVAGYSDDSGGNDRALRWTNPGGATNLGLLPGGAINSYAEAIDSSGTILAGYGDSGSTRAFRWTTGGGYQLLPVAPGASPSNFNQALGISQSGAIVVGTAGLSNGARAFLWNSASPGSSLNLGVLAGQTSSGARAISGDETAVTGASGPFAVRWTAAGGMLSIGSLPGQVWALGEAINHNGTVITGRYSNGSEFGYRWSSGGGMVALPQTPNGCIALRPRAINGDGNLIIGQVVDNVAGFTAFVWTPTLGTQLLANHLAARGVNMTGWQLRDATGISADGRSMCGTGIYNGNFVGWVVSNLPCASIVPTYGSTSQCVGGLGNINTGLNTVAGAVYRWERSGVTIVDGLQPSGSTVSGATTNAITWTNFQPSDGGPITFFMSSQGACEGSFTIPFQGAYGTITIGVQPSPNTACVGQNPSLFCAATTDVGTVFYNWQRFVAGNWTYLVNGPTGSGSSYFGNGTTTLSILNAQAADSGLYRCQLVSSSCTGFPATFSNAVQFTINGSPLVTAPPIVYSCVGDVDAFIGVSASPPTGTTYQWQRNVGPTQNSFVDIFDGPTGNGSFYGQTNSASLGIYAFTAADAGKYRCRVTGPCGPSVNGPGIDVLALPPAAVISGPVDTSQCIGDNDAFFSVIATPGVGYRWQKAIGPGPNDFVNIFDGPTGNGGNFGGTGTPNFGVFGVYPPDLIRYRCVVIDPCFSPNAISLPASLLAGPEATITGGPSQTPGCVGGTSTLTVAVSPPGGSYQWQKRNPIFANVYNNVIDGPTGTGGTYVGAQSSTLQIVGIVPADTDGEYRCLAYSGCGNVPAESPDATFFLLNQPDLLTQPVGGPVCINGSKSLSVAIGTGSYGTVSYEWWRFTTAFPIFAMLSDGVLPSGASVSGASTQTFTISGFKPQDAGQYYCRVVGECGFVTSTVVNLVSCPADFNCSGTVEVTDIFAFLTAWFAQSPAADFDGSNTINVADIFAFLAAWFAKC